MLTATTDHVMTESEYLEQYIGDKIAIICARFQYWGFLSSLVMRDERVIGVVLSDACCVEQSGASQRDKPEHTDAVGGSMMIMLDATEIIYQPNWSKGPLPSEEEKSSKKKRK